MTEKLPENNQVISSSSLDVEFKKKITFEDLPGNRIPLGSVWTQRRASTSWNVAVQLRGGVDGVKGHIWSSLSFSQANVSIGRTQKRPEAEAGTTDSPSQRWIRVYMCAVEVKPLIKRRALKRLYMPLYAVMSSLCCGGRE